MADSKGMTSGLGGLGQLLRSNKGNEILIGIAVLIVIMMLIIPLPAFMLDLLMAFNLGFSILIILMVLYTTSPLQFSVFPSILLISAVFGLALNVSSTRLILSQGSEFDGKIVKAFSQFVVGTDGMQGLVIGSIIFAIIMAVQVLVITKGATRIAEVAARFTLDKVPQKQMGIEQEIASGFLTEEEAIKKKRDLDKEADFYGAMDGATKFVSGNVKVGILITFINIIGGMIVGITLHGEAPVSVAGTYIALTIGDGLVSQFPALFISVATGLIVTRAISDESFGDELAGQFAAQGRIYWILAAFLGLLALLPGFPHIILLILAAASAVLGFVLTRKKQVQAREEESKEAAEKEKRQAPETISAPSVLDPVSMELGFGLIPLVSEDKGAELLDRVFKIRREAALDMGLVVPPIRIIDNMRLQPNEYCIKIKGVEVGRGILKLSQYMAINPGGEREPLAGEATTDPAFGLPAIWVHEDEREKAEREGYTIVDPPSIIATHLTEVIKQHGAEILGRQEVQTILDNLKKEYPVVVEEVSGLFSVGEIQKVLQGLLAEQVSVRNVVVIMETLSDYGKITKDPVFLIEKVRQALARQICLQYADEDKVIRTLVLEPGLEQKIIDSREETPMGIASALDPDLQESFIALLADTIKQLQEEGHLPVLLCSEAARPLVHSSTKRSLPFLAVLSWPEIAPGVKVESLGEISI